MDRRCDTAVALCVAIFGVFLLIAAHGIKPASVADPIGSRGIPLLIATVLALTGLSLTLRRILRWRREPTMVPPEGDEDETGVPPGSAVRAVSIWATGLVYILILPYAGYLLSTPVFLFVALWLSEVRRPSMLVGVPLGFSVPVFLMFSEFLNIRLPTGILDGPLRHLGLV